MYFVGWVDAKEYSIKFQARIFRMSRVFNVFLFLFGLFGSLPGQPRIVAHVENRMSYIPVGFKVREQRELFLSFSFALDLGLDLIL